MAITKIVPRIRLASRIKVEELDSLLEVIAHVSTAKPMLNVGSQKPRLRMEDSGCSQ